MSRQDKMIVLAGSSVPTLASRVAKRAGGISNNDITKVELERFSDGEISVEILQSVRNRDAYIMQSVCAPANDNLMELLLISDALKRSSVKSITAVVPYMGYSRQDRRPGFRRMPISIRLVADMMKIAGIKSVLTVDIHAKQIQGMFSMPLISVSAASLFVADIYKSYTEGEYVVVSPDAGGVERARSVAKQLDADLAVIDKRRQKANHSEVMNVLGEVEGKDCVIIDDLVDTAGTLCNGAAALKDRGARKVSAYCTHPVLSGAAVANLNSSVINEMVVTDTIPLNGKQEQCDRIRVLTIAGLLSETIRRVQTGESVSAIYMME